MSQIFYMEESQIRANFAPEMTVRSLVESLQRELAGKHLVMTKLFLDGNSFIPEEVIDMATQTGDISLIQYEVTSVKQIVDEMTAEWAQILEKLIGRTKKVLKKTLTHAWIAEESDDIFETFQDLLDSFESIKSYFGDQLLAPHVQIEDAKKKMVGMMVSLQEATKNQDVGQWQKIIKDEFVGILELWQTFFYGIRRVFF